MGPNEDKAQELMPAEKEKNTAINVRKVDNGYLLSNDNYPRLNRKSSIANNLEEVFAQLKEFFK